MKTLILSLIVLVTAATACSKEVPHSQNYNSMCWTIIYKDSIGYTCPPYTDTIKFYNPSK